ncbi:MAG TPA: ferrochelatase [Kofleriaceae bacterium]|nr:ferrochelatase [Kofleriaceae bacterium]
MTGLLLINLGTPDAPTTPAVRRYLREFLSDPRVLDMNPVGRWFLLNVIILPFRPARSAEAYQKIWTERGSPLLFHGLDVAELVRERLGPTWRVELAMRYGSPSIESALTAFRQAGVDRIVVFPLFPHYASSSTGSALEAVHAAAGRLWNVPQLSVISSFYDEPVFIDAFAQVGRRALAEANADHVIMSFHGLPERQVLKSDDTGAHCLKSATCCDQIVVANRNCYRAQCFATARALAAALELGPDGYTVAFQSRLGKTPWIRPFTDELLDELAAQGKRRLAVFCPAFVADCLETIEEIGIRAREQFKAAGGDEVVLVPSLNAEAAWADAIVSLIRTNAERSAPATP